MDDGAPDDSPNEPYERDGYDSDGWPLDDGSLFVEVDFGCADDSYEAPVIRGRRLDNFPHGSAFERVAFVGCIRVPTMVRYVVVVVSHTIVISVENRV